MAKGGTNCTHCCGNSVGDATASLRMNDRGFSSNRPLLITIKTFFWYIIARVCSMNSLDWLNIFDGEKVKEHIEEKTDQLADASIIGLVTATGLPQRLHWVFVLGRDEIVERSSSWWDRCINFAASVLRGVLTSWHPCEEVHELRDVRVERCINFVKCREVY